MRSSDGCEQGSVCRSPRTDSGGIYEEVVGNKEIHPQYCLFHVHHHKGQKETAAGKEGLREGSRPVCGDRSKLFHNEVVRRVRRGTTVLFLCWNHTHLRPRIHQEADPRTGVPHPEKDTLAGRKPLGVPRR